MLAANGDKVAVDLMKQAAKENPFLPAYIDFISHVNVVDFKKHLLTVMSLWTETVLSMTDANPIASHFGKRFD